MINIVIVNNTSSRSSDDSNIDIHHVVIVDCICGSMNPVIMRMAGKELESHAMTVACVTRSTWLMVVNDDELWLVVISAVLSSNWLKNT